MTQASVHTQAPASRTAPSLAKSILGPPPKAEPSGDTQAAREVAAALIDRWYNDPVLFAWEACGLVLWRGQRDICAAVVAKWPCRVAVRSGHKCGKALALDTPIPTPAGWSIQGELRVGDQVFDEA
jgi:hypothetical protein